MVCDFQNNGVNKNNLSTDCFPKLCTFSLKRHVWQAPKLSQNFTTMKICPGIFYFPKLIPLHQTANIQLILGEQ